MIDQTTNRVWRFTSQIESPLGVRVNTEVVIPANIAPDAMEEESETVAALAHRPIAAVHNHVEKGFVRR